MSRVDVGCAKDHSAKEIIKSHASEAHFLPFSYGGVDVDTPDDFSRLIMQDQDL